MENDSSDSIIQFNEHRRSTLICPRTVRRAGSLLALQTLMAAMRLALQVPLRSARLAQGGAAARRTCAAPAHWNMARVVCCPTRG